MATTPKQTPAQEKAAIKWMAEKYGLAASLITDPKNKDLYKLFQTAIKEKWAEDQTGNAQAKFMAGLRNTNWWKTQSDTWRQMEIQRVTDPKSYQLRIKRDREKFENLAVGMGANFSEHMRDLIINQGISEGWDDKVLSQHMAAYIKRDAQGNLGGTSGQLEQQLRQVAVDNGIHMTDRFYADAARSVGQGQQTGDDWANWIRGQAAHQYGAYADQIKAGVSLKQLAAGVTSAVAGELELNPEDVGLNDELVQKAITNTDEAGKPAPLPLWKVKQMARQDVRYQSTTKAKTDQANVGMDLLKAWGFVK